MIALMDVHYRDSPTGTQAHAACVLATDWQAAKPALQVSLTLTEVAEYQPGEFYRRELPCLLQLLKQLPTPPSLLVIDGYVWLDDADRPGLGAHLYKALGQCIGVIGIAKTAFVGVNQCQRIAAVLRGSSRRPLYVSAAGYDLQMAAQAVGQMHGPHRIPDLLQAVDALSRSDISDRKGEHGIL